MSFDLDPISMLRNIALQHNLYANSNLTLETEITYVSHLINKNVYTKRASEKNVNSLVDAFLVAGKSGLTFNPEIREIYLSEKNEEVVLEVSFNGLKKATESLSEITRCNVHLVYELDSFKWNGHYVVPDHQYDTFANDHTRGALKGAYCVTQFADSTFWIEHLSLDQILKSRKEGLSNHSGSWLQWMEEMVKKTVLLKSVSNWPLAIKDKLDVLVTYLNHVYDLRYQLRAQRPTDIPEDDSPLTHSELESFKRDLDFIDQINKVIYRAKTEGAWMAAKEYFSERCSNPRSKIFALNAIEVEMKNCGVSL